MATLTAQGFFLARTTPGTTVVTVGFQAKAIVFFATLQTAAGWGTSPPEASWSMGCAAFNASRGVTNYATRDNGTPSRTVVESGIAQSLRLLRDSVPTQDCLFTITAIDATSFTVTYSVLASSAWRVYWYAVGGSDIVDSDAGIITISPVLGIDSTSSPGFRPDFVMVLRGVGFSTIGMASGPAASEQACLFGGDVNGENPSNERFSWLPGSLGGTYRISGASPFTWSIDKVFRLNSFTALGFSWEVTTAGVGSRDFVYLAIQGGRHQVGVATTPLATGIQTITLGRAPAGVFTFSGLRPTGSTLEDVKFSVGATDGANRGGVAIGSVDNVAVTVTDHWNDAARLLLSGATIGTPSSDSLADIDGLGQTGFTLDWEAVSGAAEEFAYWAVGPRSRRTLLPIMHAGP